MEQIADLFIHDIVANFSAYSIPIWQPLRIKHAMSLLSEEIANNLDYSNPSACIKSLAKELDIDVTPSIVKNNFPVWIDLPKTETFIPQSDRLVITYIEALTDDIIPIINRIEAYANKVSADFVLLQGRTQGYIQLEKHRIKPFVELYDRTLFISTNIYISDECPNLFDVVTNGHVGIADDKPFHNRKNPDTPFLLRSDYFSRAGSLSPQIDSMVSYEASIIDTYFDDNIVLCDREHADIWDTFKIPFRFKNDRIKENRAWMEILIHRYGYDVFILDEKFNYPVSINPLLPEKIQEAKVIRYEDYSIGQNIINTWLDDNSIIGYKEKDPVDMSTFKILSLYHKDEQKESIQNRGYLEFFNLNDMGSKFDNSFTESRIYYEDFEYLFPEGFEYIGLTTGSWNLKYIGMNPIDQLHNWAAIRRVDENVVLCADTETTSRFFRDRKSVLHNVFNEMNLDLIKEFLQLINLPIEYKEKQVPVSNQIIAKRSIVKSLFDFYQSNEILDKIAFFIDKHQLTVKEKAYGGDAYRRRSGFFAETATALWLNNNDFTIMPQEILKRNWYK